MSPTLIAKPTQVTDNDLASIVADASFLWERLNCDRFILNSDQINQTELEKKCDQEVAQLRCDRWQKNVAQENKLEILQKRLQWEGLKLDDIRPRLGKVKLAAGASLPKWAQTLEQIITTAATYNPETQPLSLRDGEKLIPFEDLWLPAIEVGRKNLLTRLGVTKLTPENLPLTLFSEKAYASLERRLLQRLSLISAKTLDFEFSKIRPFGQNLLNLLGIEEKKEDSTSKYHQFVTGLLEDGLLSFFQQYPVLGRLIAVAVDLWVAATAEFIQRLDNDQGKIQQVFNQEKSDLGQVSAIKTSLSDPHNQGRTVILLTFESGLKLVYKPKDLGLELAWNQFLIWCNQKSQLLDLKVIEVLNRDGYGWVEYVEHLPCRDQDGVKRFYQRAGMLMSLIYLLRGTDCHNENLIASGEDLVLIDMESLLHHESKIMEDSPEAEAFETESVQLFWNSVLRTGLLPRWDFGSDQRVAYDISGLGGVSPQQIPRKVQRWQAVNTDNMHLRSETITMPVQKNMPLWGETTLSPNDYQEQIVAGFEQMYRFLMEHQRQLLAADSPLAQLQQQRVRFIFRATRIYFTILKNAWAPDYLKNGVDYSIELESLSRAFVIAEQQPDAWPILRAEIQAMEQLDIPFFTANTSSDALKLNNIPAIAQYFKQSSYQQVLEKLQNLDQVDLAQQIAIIQGAFSARIAQSSTTESYSWQEEDLPLLTQEQLIQAARAIASELEARALPDADGSLNWIGLGFVPQAEHFQLQVLNNSLYDGRCGIAIFLAGLYQVTQEAHFKDIARRVLQPLRRQLQNMNSASRQRFARLMGLGGAAGVGSVIYTFVKVSQLLDEQSLLADAQLLAREITSDLIAADQTLDLISGAAGAIPGLLSLYQATKEEFILEKAIACGEHLLTQQISDQGVPKAWKTITEKPLPGFAHGAAGIAYALLRLYLVTQDSQYLEAALEGINYERSVFSATEANWPDFRGVQAGKQPSFPIQWCYGAPGVGLARLGSLDMMNSPEIVQEIAIALQTTQKQGLKAIDHLCCGNLGLVEVLLVGAQRCNREDWREAALKKATAVVTRAEQSGAYKLFANLPNSVFNPGFFQGTAGIGYQLLRLANDDLPSVMLWD